MPIQASWAGAVEGWGAGAARTQRQSGRGSYLERLCVEHPPGDARAGTVAAGYVGTRHICARVMATISPQPVCGRVVTAFAPTRHPDSAAVSGFRTGWRVGAAQRVQIPTVGRAAAHPAAHGNLGDAETMGPRRSVGAMSPARPGDAGGAPVAPDRLSGSITGAGLAAPVVARSGDSNRERGNATSARSGRGLDIIRESQPGVASSDVDHPRGSSNPLEDLASRRVMAIAGPSVGAVSDANMVTDYAWAPRTNAARASQWKAWLSFCGSDGRAPLLVTEGHVLAFIGWAKKERIAGHRHTASIPQYISAVRSIHKMYTETEVPPFPFMDVVLRSYRKWEEAKFPNETV